jgi:recombination protein O
MRNFKTEGIIIKRRNHNEADRILTVMTRDYGKIQVKATGVRKITSRRSAHIELLNHTALHLYKGSGFTVLTEARVIDDFALIKKDFTKIGQAYHVCELVDGLCPDNQENSAVFTLLKRTLGRLLQENEESYTPAYLPEEIDDYTLGTYGIGVSDAPQHSVPKTSLLQSFETSLLSELGYWDEQSKTARHVDTHDMIENILERRLKSRSIFAKLQ